MCKRLIPVLVVAAPGVWCVPSAPDATAVQTATERPANTDGVLTFAVTSDHMEDLPKNIIKGLVDAKPKFVVLNGDIVFNGREADFRKLTRVFLEPLKQAGIDWYPVIGNHDFPVEPNWKKFWGQDKGRPYYSFDSGPAHLVILDSNKLVYGGRTYKEGTELAYLVEQSKDLAKGSEQYNWLAGDLDKTRQKFIFVFHHEPAVSFGDNG